ncbi:MAG: efflux RND transporter permease subunit, partial [Fusobacteriota bacterium]
YPVKYFGIFTAIGVLLAMLLSLVFLPAALKIIGLPRFKKKKESDIQNKGIRKLTGLILKNSNKVFISTIVLIILSGYGITKVWVDSSFLDKFEDDSKIVKADNFINKNFGGTTNLNIIFEGDVDDFKKPDNLKKVEDLQNELESLEEVGNTFGLTDYIKRMNKVMNENKEEKYSIPGSQNLIAQYLLLYSMSGDTEKLDRVVDYNYERINLQVQLKGDNSDLMDNVLNVVENNRENFTNIKINYAGSAYKAYVFSDLILEGQIRSLVMSLFIVIILISLMFKSLSAGIIGAIPITITALVNFGVMGFTGIPLSSTTALLSSIAVGIGIDYAIHFLERYRISALDQEKPEDIAKDTMEHTGKAILFNALVVVSGFSVLIFSVFPPNRELGILASMNMFITFIITLTTMLVIINLVKPKFIFKSKLGGVKNEN